MTPTDQIKAGVVIRVVGISTSYRPENPDVVPLGSRDDGRIHTRLRRDSAASVGLTSDVPFEQLTPTAGRLSAAELVDPVTILWRAGKFTG